MEKVKIEVYGGINIGGGGCSCGCSGCTTSDAREEYEVMKKEVLERFQDMDLSMEFIDTDDVSLAAFPEVEEVIKSGYPFPITVINGNPRFAGKISADPIIEIVTGLRSKMQ